MHLGQTLVLRNVLDVYASALFLQRAATKGRALDLDAASCGTQVGSPEATDQMEQPPASRAHAYHDQGDDRKCAYPQLKHTTRLVSLDQAIH